MFVALPATDETFDCIPATVLTLLLIPATVETLASIPATVDTLLAIPATVLIFVVMSASEFTFAIVGPASAAPVVALKPSTVPTLLAFNGNTIEAASSLSFNLTALSIRSCWSSNKAIFLSSSVLSVSISKEPDVGKSVVLLKGIFLKIITVPDDTSLPDVIVIEPVLSVFWFTV